MAKLVTDEVKASTTLAGLVKLSLAPAVASNPIAVGDNDPRLGGGGGSGSIVFKPDVASSGGHYQTAAEVATALNAVNGATTVYCDSSVSPCILPAGVTWDFKMTGALCGGGGEEAGASLIVQEGGHLKNIRFLKFITIDIQNTTTPVFTYDTPLLLAYALQPIWENSIIYTTTTNAGPLIAFPNDSGMGLVLTNTQLFSTGRTGPWFTLGTTNHFSIWMLLTAWIGGDCELVTSDVTSLFTVHHDSTSEPPLEADSPSFLGTWTTEHASLSQLVGYTPAVPGDWPVVPTTVKEALDTISAGGMGGGGSPNLDGGKANSTYGGISPIVCGGA